jgi:hypothetical protein
MSAFPARHRGERFNVDSTASRTMRSRSRMSTGLATTSPCSERQRRSRQVAFGGNAVIMTTPAAGASWGAHSARSRRFARIRQTEIEQHRRRAQDDERVIAARPRRRLLPVHRVPRLAQCLGDAPPNQRLVVDDQYSERRIGGAMLGRSSKMRPPPTLGQACPRRITTAKKMWRFRGICPGQAPWSDAVRRATGLAQPVHLLE